MLQHLLEIVQINSLSAIARIKLGLV